MKVLNNKKLNSLRDVCTSLKKGGVVVHPTETCYGLAVDIFQYEALQKVYRIKEMREDKPVSIMVENLQQAQIYGIFNDIALRLACQFWPGPLTIIVQRRNKAEDTASGLPVFLNPGINTIGFRCPDHDVTQKLLKTYGKPLATTSANISGFPETYDIKFYLQQLCKYYGVENVSDIADENLPDCIVDGGSLPNNPPSTIIDCSELNPSIHRKGSLSEKIKDFLSSCSESQKEIK